MWSGSHLKPYMLRNLQDFQKVNHFPRYDGGSRRKPLGAALIAVRLV